MDRTVVINKHETIVDKEYLDNLKSSHVKLYKFAKWCLSNKFDSRDIGVRAADALKGPYDGK